MQEVLFGPRIFGRLVYVVLLVACEPGPAGRDPEGVAGSEHAHPAGAPESKAASSKLNALLLLEQALRLDGSSPTKIPDALAPWGGPTLSSFWPPEDKRATLSDADSTAWHFRANGMPIPSAVTNRFLSPAPLPTVYQGLCMHLCKSERLPRFFQGRSDFDLLAAVNFAAALDTSDALNREVQRAVSALLAALRRTSNREIDWSVRPPTARRSLVRQYARGQPWVLPHLSLFGEDGPVVRFEYLRLQPSGERLAVQSKTLAIQLQSTSSSSSN